mgnify:CR=1 FL=1
MTAPVWQRAEPESPCINICQIHPASRLCLGCHRTIDEIAGWAGYSSSERQAVLDMLPERAASAQPGRQGGRAARLAERRGKG